MDVKALSVVGEKRKPCHRFNKHLLCGAAKVKARDVNEEQVTCLYPPKSSTTRTCLCFTLFTMVFFKITNNVMFISQ